MADEDLVPFTIEIPDAELDDLRARLAATRWPAKSPDAAWVRGIPVAYLQELARYWEQDFDWRAQEARLNALPQFTTTLDGQRLHLVHVTSPVPDALPLVITHGWPGSVVEFLDVIGPLTDPEAHGGDRRDAFHVVAPSIPGFAFSTPLAGAGWDPTRIARTWAELMARLGYDRYAAQGGDWGSHISRELAIEDPEHVVGVHLNMLMNTGEQAPDDLTPEEQERLDRAAHFVREGSGYNRIQATRPQTLSYGLTDSPAGQLAWIAEKFYEWTDNDGSPEDAVDRDLMLANISLYWFTRTAGSSAQIYYERVHGGRGPREVTVPTGVAVFPADITRPVRRMSEQSHHVVRWTELDRGGHFAAMEEPDLLVEEIRGMFRDLR